MNVDESKTVLAKLEDKLVEETNRSTELQTERRKLSFLAFSDNEEARAKLDELNAESAIAGLEAQNIRAAIDEARHRLTAAQREEGLAKQRANARQAKAILTVAEQRGPKMATALRDLCTELDDFRADMRGLAQYGAPVSDYRLVELWLMRSIFPSLRAAGLVRRRACAETLLRLPTSTSRTRAAGCPRPWARTLRRRQNRRSRDDPLQGPNSSRRSSTDLAGKRLCPAPPPAVVRR
jgi:hypothetical protein